MTHWSRAVTSVKCGRCGERVPEGAPVFTVTARAPYTGRFYRCATCAGEPVPVCVPKPTAPPIVPFGGFTLLKFPAATMAQELYTNRRLGEREPGDEP